MTYNEIRDAISEARSIINNAEDFTKRGVEMATGKLQRLNLSDFYLSALKRELTRYNTHTRKWK